VLFCDVVGLAIEIIAIIAIEIIAIIADIGPRWSH